MTTPWQINKIWDGETVAVLGAGPDMTAELVAQLTAKGFKTIAVNRAVNVAPGADMFVALDPLPEFWDGRETFEGIKICGIDCDIDARYVGMLYETVQIAAAHSVEIRNNALAAIRIAEKCGAKTIMLYGFDAERYQALHAHTGFFGFVEGLAQIKAELQAKGIEVVDVKPEVVTPVSKVVSKAAAKK